MRLLRNLLVCDASTAVLLLLQGLTFFIREDLLAPVRACGPWEQQTSLHALFLVLGSSPVLRTLASCVLVACRQPYVLVCSFFHAVLASLLRKLSRERGGFLITNWLSLFIWLATLRLYYCYAASCFAIAIYPGP